MTDNFSEDGSVTQWIADMRRGDPDAADRISRQYFERLAALARRRLGDAPRRVADEEDIAVSVLHRLCDGIQQDRFPVLRDREDLWALLLTITRGKVADQIKHNQREKRGGGNVRGHSVFGTPGDNPVSDFAEVIEDELTPDFVAQLDEQQGRLLSQLRDDTHRNIAVWRMEGYSNEEIASRLDISVKSVERKLRNIRNKWAKEVVGK
ncbi:MAG: ECF-type sigma factor [Fuerstiella sp.]